MRYLDKLKLNTVIDEPAKNRALGEVAKDIKKSYKDNVTKFMRDTISYVKKMK